MKSSYGTSVGVVGVDLDRHLGILVFCGDISCQAVAPSYIYNSMRYNRLGNGGGSHLDARSLIGRHYTLVVKLMVLVICLLSTLYFTIYCITFTAQYDPNRPVGQLVQQQKLQPQQQPQKLYQSRPLRDRFKTTERPPLHANSVQLGTSADSRVGHELFPFGMLASEQDPLVDLSSYNARIHELVNHNSLHSTASPDSAIAKLNANVHELEKKAAVKIKKIKKQMFDMLTNLYQSSQPIEDHCGENRQLHHGGGNWTSVTLDLLIKFWANASATATNTRLPLAVTSNKEWRNTTLFNNNPNNNPNNNSNNICDIIFLSDQITIDLGNRINTNQLIHYWSSSESSFELPVSVTPFTMLDSILQSNKAICDLVQLVRNYPVFSKKVPIERMCQRSKQANQSIAFPTTTLNTDVKWRMVIRKLVLVTSFNPLRAFLYEEDIILDQHHFHPYLNESNKFFHTFTNQSQKNLYDSAKQKLSTVQLNVNQTLTQTFLLLDSAEWLLTIPLLANKSMPFDKPNNQSRHFQLYAVDLEITSTGSVDVLAIKHWLQENYENSSNNNKLDYNTKQEIMHKSVLLERSIHLVLANVLESQFDQIKNKLGSLLEENIIGIIDLHCMQWHKVCLNQQDLWYLFETSGQANSETTLLDSTESGAQFQLLYPVDETTSAIYRLDSLFDSMLMHMYSVRNGNDADDGRHYANTYTMVQYRTEQLHFILTQYQFTNSDKQANDHDHHGHYPLSSDAISSNQINSVQQMNSFDLTNLMHQEESWINQIFDANNVMSNIIINYNNSNDYSAALVTNTLCQHDDPDLYGHLTQLEVLIPENVQLVPPFNPYHFHYHLNVDANYWDLMISLDVAVAHCDTWLSIENRLHLQSGVFNFTLGLGENQINLNLVTTAQAKSNINLLATSNDFGYLNATGTHLASYTIVVYRLSREEQYEGFELVHNTPNMSVCELLQDCSMQLYSKLPCGLLSTGVSIAKIDVEQQFKSQLNHMLANQHNTSEWCKDGAAEGRWYVPCTDCSEESSCLWQHMQWLPLNCRYHTLEQPLDQQQLAQCLNGKQILFIGDSTNRGILHYLVEKLNGTLSEADKTHDMKRYQLSSGPGTSAYLINANFAYYPKFWIPLYQRPSFVQVFRKSIQSVRTKMRGTTGERLVFIVGGVQWLARKHLQMMHEQLALLHLQNATIVIKTLGSGFHQPATGVHYMPLSEQRKLATHNEALVSEARKYNMRVVDTFNITIPLYRDFYPGKCACHFHKVIKQDKQQHPLTVATTTNNKEQRHSSVTPSVTHDYHVRGQLNSLYSNILISQLCN